MSGQRPKRRRSNGASPGSLFSSSRLSTLRSRRSDGRKSASGEKGENSKATAKRRYIWTYYPDSGFPNRVNHAVASHVDHGGGKYVFSVGGYHADDDERTVLQADTLGGPFFRSSPIDVHCMDVGACIVCVYILRSCFSAAHEPCRTRPIYCMLWVTIPRIII